MRRRSGLARRHAGQCHRTFHLAEALADSVARSERRLIVNISSGMGSIAENTDGGSPIYRSSKAAPVSDPLLGP
jgi:short-subunit dehydrogenase involved in D-alanine esterification of teichoic acids